MAMDDHGSMNMGGQDSMSMDEHNAIMEEQDKASGTSPMIYIALGISLLSFLLAVIALLRKRA